MTLAEGEGQFRPVRLAAPIPAVAWLPEHAPGAPVVLLGHGGSGNKCSARNRRLGALLTARGVAALAIDGPHHGDRVSTQVAPADYQQRMVDTGMATVIHHMTADWMAALDAAADAARLDTTRVGYLGLSMGSRFGIPLAAELGPRLVAAVFGKFGLQEHPGAPRGLETPDLHRAAGAALRAPLIFHLQWDDDVFPREGGLTLFDVLGSHDKTLLARPGPHNAQHPDDETNWARFLARHLAH